MTARTHWAGRRRWLRGLLSVTASLVLTACGGGGDSGGDTSNPSAAATWAAATSSLAEELPAYTGIVPPSPTTISDSTVRQVAHVAMGGDRMRIRLSNRYGTAPITFTKVRAAPSTGAAAIDTSKDTAVTFGGTASVTVAAGQEAWSDFVAMEIAPASDIAVSIYVQGQAEFISAHRFAMATHYVNAGDTASAATMDTGAGTAITAVYWLNELDVERQAAAPVIVAFGDSITDGYGSTPGANRRYTDLLAKRFRDASVAGSTSVVNTGLGGNRWLYDEFGQRGIDRFQRDVLEVTGVTHAIVLLGTNDIGNQVLRPTQTVTAQALIAAMSTAAASAKAAGVKVYFGTITPFGGTAYFTADNELLRQTVNDWIRTNTVAAGYVDFDKAVRDLSDPTRYAAGISGDNLHPNDAGYQMMADAVPLELFR